jgi:hypothetical protein
VVTDAPVVREYPVVLKPDVGERGRDVAICRNEPNLRRYFEIHRGKTIVQRYVDGLEFGIFYYRYPSEPKGRIFSITSKHFPKVVGDGIRRVSELILADERASCIADVYLARVTERIPSPGEVVPLAELGSHCRGAVFLDGSSLETPELTAAVDAVANCHSGCYFGRFDVRSPSIADLQAGRFEVLELNGVSAEATHIYDPAVSVVEAYRVLFRQWRIAFEIGAANRAGGTKPMSLGELSRLVRARR